MVLSEFDKGHGPVRFDKGQGPVRGRRSKGSLASLGAGSSLAAGPSLDAGTSLGAEPSLDAGPSLGVWPSFDAGTSLAPLMSMTPRLPNDINVTFQSEANTFAELNLKRVDHITSNVPIYTIDTDEEGVKIKKEDVQGNENIAFYQDAKNDAVIQVLRLNDSVGQTEKFIITDYNSIFHFFINRRGKYRQGDDMYSILPAVRSKRQTSEHGDQSDLTSQRYEVMPMKTPTERQTDFMTAPPKFDSFENLRVLSKRFQQDCEILAKKATVHLHVLCGRHGLPGLHVLQQVTSLILPDEAFEAYSNNPRCELDQFWLTTMYQSNSVIELLQPDNCPAARQQCQVFNSRLGLAWVETLCRTDGVSSSVIEDMGNYSAIFTGA
ncbi:hypothetical protein Btru_071415 [Bulinus truncatus]|nr:hypothetical protein Btru_071415 [Bulinus truncatus]